MILLLSFLHIELLLLLFSGKNPIDSHHETCE